MNDANKKYQKVLSKEKKTKQYLQQLLWSLNSSQSQRILNRLLQSIKAFNLLQLQALVFISLHISRAGLSETSNPETGHRRRRQGATLPIKNAERAFEGVIDETVSNRYNLYTLFIAAYHTNDRISILCMVIRHFIFGVHEWTKFIHFFN